MKIIELKRDERIIAVVPEHCSGPGWSNAPTWVYIMQPDGSVRVECIQPDERSPSLDILFDVGAIICRDLLKAVPNEYTN